MKIDDIRNVLILGSGTMGQQIGMICAINGFNVVLYDINEDVLAKAYERIERKARKLVKMNQYSQDEATRALSRISMTTDPVKAAEGTDIISESVPEDPKLKGKIFAQFNELCRPDTIFTTNTSSLLPSQFAEASGRPDRLCALHFHDTTMTRIVDVMPHPGTSKETMDLVTVFAERIGQIPIVLDKETNGYVFNNMLMAILDSALNLASRKVAPVTEIDRSWMGVLHTLIGPFGIMDSVGLDTVWKITDYWANVRNDAQAKLNASFLKEYIDKGHLGMKTGQGFYSYPNPGYSKPGFIEGK